MDWLPDMEIVVEKDGQEIDSLPNQLKQDIEFLYEKGHNPEPHLKMSEECLPKVGKAISFSDGEDMEKVIREAIVDVSKEPPNKRSILFDPATLEQLIITEKTLAKMMALIREKNIRYLITPRTMRLIQELKRRKEEFLF